MNEEFVSRWVQRLRHEVPDAVAIFLGGSQLRGDAGPYSDVDFDIVVADGPRDEWPAWYEVAGDRLVQVSAWIRDVDTWLAAAEEPQGWAFFLACADPLRLCWAADDGWRERLDRTEQVYPPGPPESDHFEAETAKVANAWESGDELALRLVAQDLARSVVSVLRPLNPREPVHSRRAALQSLLDFDVVPAGYREDMLTCLGLDRATGPAVYAAARRLAGGVVELLVSREPALRDGNLHRYVAQALHSTASGGPAPIELYEVTLDCPEPRDLAEFYRRLLGWTYAPGHESTDPAGDEWLVLLPPEGGARMAFQRSDATVTPWREDARVHLDVAVPDLAAAHEHFVSCGAQPLTGTPAEESRPDDLYRVYADPAGHPFCATQVSR